MPIFCAESRKKKSVKAVPRLLSVIQMADEEALQLTKGKTVASYYDGVLQRTPMRNGSRLLRSVQKLDLERVENSGSVDTGSPKTQAAVYSKTCPTSRQVTVTIYSIMSGSRAKVCSSK